MRNSGQGKFGEWRVSGQGGVHSSFGEVGEEVAHARARFGVDPSTPARLSSAWTAPSGTTEEDESELIDAVADCLSVGLPIDVAVASWRSGALQVQADDADEDDVTDVYGDDDVTGVYERHGTGRRRIIES
jgi:hypothetical protein